MIRERMLVGGRWVEASGGAEIRVEDPALEEGFAVVPRATAADAEAAVVAADRAFPSWSRLSPFVRGDLLRKAADRVAGDADRIARLLTREQGKPLKEALGEVRKGAAILRYYAEEGERVQGRIVPSEDPDTESRVIRQPVGVAAAISPWNYPVELLAWKLGAALAAGCTVVAKAPSETPLSPIAFTRCLAEAGVPDGVVNLLTGRGDEIGPVLTGSPLVQKVAFTGSTETGRRILESCLPSFKKVSLELGGSLPMIVCADCDLDLAVRGAVRRSFRNMGQICISINRIYVDRRIYRPFLERFAEATERLTIGNGLTTDRDLGPMTTLGGLVRAEAHIADARSKGARLLCGGGRPEGPEFARGFFFRPTVLADADHGMRVMHEETFGPVVGVMPFSTPEEAVALANDNAYGLASIVFTRSLDTADRMALALQSGNVAVNTVDAGVLNAPYGGWKDSGSGYEHGPEGLQEYLKVKHVRVRYR